MVIFGSLICFFLFDRAVSEDERVGGDNMVYKPLGENVPDMIYLGSLTNFDLTYAWAQDKCVPLVREITFENGEVSYCRLGNGIEATLDSLSSFAPAWSHQSVFSRN